MKNITNYEKIYWNAEQPIAKENILFAQDWNKIVNNINDINECISTISSCIISVFNNPPNISSFIISNCPLTTSYLSTINGLYNEKFNGISTIKINDQEYYGSFHLNFLQSTSELVNTFNNNTGIITNVLTGIKIDDSEPLTTQVITLNDVFLNNEIFVRSIDNNLTGDANGNIEVITSIIIDEKRYNSLNDNYQLSFPNTFDANLYKRTGEILIQADIPTEQDQTEDTIFNLQMFQQYHQVSATINTNSPLELSNAIDWICITDQDHSIITPSRVTLINNTLTITSPRNGIVYYLSKI